jgi:hypothetical protein
MRRCVAGGGQVQLLLAGQTDVPVARYAAHHLYATMLAGGARLYEYQPQVLHAKLFIAGRGGQGGSLVRSRQPVSAPRRPGAEPGQYRQRVTRSRSRPCCWGVTEARAKVGTIQATPELVNDEAGLQEVPGRAGRTVARAQEPDRGHARTIRSSSPTRTSATCRRSSRALKTASPWRAIATSTGGAASTTSRSARSRATSRR